MNYKKNIIIYDLNCSNKILLFLLFITNFYLKIGKLKIKNFNLFFKFF